MDKAGNWSDPSESLSVKTQGTYKVTLNKGSYITGVSGGGSKTSGSSVTVTCDVQGTSTTWSPSDLPANASNNGKTKTKKEQSYQFTNWTGSLTSNSKSYTFTMPENDVTLTANGGLGTSKNTVYQCYCTGGSANAQTGTTTDGTGKQITVEAYIGGNYSSKTGTARSGSSFTWSATVSWNSNSRTFNFSAEWGSAMASGGGRAAICQALNTGAKTTGWSCNAKFITDNGTWEPNMQLTNVSFPKNTWVTIGSCSGLTWKTYGDTRTWGWKVIN